MSVAGSLVEITALDWVPSANVTWITLALATTCRAVMISPFALMITPLPRLPLGAGVAGVTGVAVATGPVEGPLEGPLEGAADAPGASDAAGAPDELAAGALLVSIRTSDGWIAA